MKVLLPTPRARTSSTATTLGTFSTISVILATAPTGAGVGQLFDGPASQAPPPGDANQKCDGQSRGGIRPPDAKADADQPADHGQRRPQIGGEMWQRPQSPSAILGRFGDAGQSTGTEEISMTT